MYATEQFNTVDAYQDLEGKQCLPSSLSFFGFRIAKLSAA